MQKLVWQNANGVELDLTSGNYGITEWEGFSNTSLNIQSQQVPSQDGGVFLDALIEQRELSVTLAIQDNNNLELRYQQRRELISALNPKLGEGYLIYTNDFISKRIKCVPQIPLFETHNSDTVGTPKASLTWTACSPYWEDLEETEVYLVGGQQSNEIVNKGDVEVGVKVDIFAGDNVNGVLISNVQQNKNIGIKGQYAGKMQINTEKGQKTIQRIEPSIYNVISASYQADDIIYSEEKRLFVSVGGNIVGISKDGNIWEYQRIDTTLRSICYAKEKSVFCAVGGKSGKGDIFLSEDCKTWQKIQINTNNTSFRGVVYSEEKHLFIAVGECIAKSIDGEQWTVIQTGLHPNILTDICYSKKDEKFVAVGMNDTVAISSDGDNWNITTSGDLMEMFSITYSENLEMYCKSSYNGSIKTSTDAITWTSASLPAISNWARVRWAESIRSFVAIAQQGSIEISSDGIDWKNTGVAINNQLIQQIDLKGICCSVNQGILVAVGTDGGIAKSTNGINWRYSSFNISRNISFRDIAYNIKKNIYLCVGDNGRILISYDIINWEYKIFSNTISFKKVIYSESFDCFIAVAATSSLSQHYILKSKDGVEWEYIYNSSTVLNDICYSEKLKQFCVCGAGIITSTNLTNWESQSISADNTLNSLIYKNEKYFVCGGNQIFSSENGVIWEDLNFPQTSENLTNISFQEIFGVYLVIGTYIWSSVDLINWQKINIEGETGFTGIIYFKQDGMLILYKGDKKYYSYDLINWQSFNIIGYVRNVRIINGELWILGDPACILKSKEGNYLNIIDKITNNSDITLGLSIGDNRIVLSTESGGVINGIITYRQKYIGV